MKTIEKSLRILIIEDEIIICRDIEQLLERHFNCETRIALTIEEAETEATHFLPHLMLCDINLSDEHVSGIELVQQLQKKLHFETIFITANSSKDIIEKAAFTAPANYIIKPFDDNQLIAAIKIAQNRLLNTPQMGNSKFDVEAALSKTEYNILKLIGANKTTPEIAQELFISPLTVKNHRHNITRKLKIPSDNNALVKWTLENRQLLGV